MRVSSCSYNSLYNIIVTFNENIQEDICIVVSVRDGFILETIIGAVQCVVSVWLEKVRKWSVGSADE